jgi:hypothetical protein
MPPNSDVGRKRASAELMAEVEQFTIDWSIRNFIAWAESKEIGYCQNSPSFKFYSPNLRKTLSFTIGLYPKGLPSSGDSESSSARNRSYKTYFTLWQSRALVCVCLSRENVFEAMLCLCTCGRKARLGDFSLNWLLLETFWKI